MGKTGKRVALENGKNTARVLQKNHTEPFAFARTR